jgi:hypothetical protein
MLIDSPPVGLIGLSADSRALLDTMRYISAKDLELLDHLRGWKEKVNSPVKMFWNADSTLDASSADVSMNDNPFSAKTNIDFCKENSRDPRVKTFRITNMQKPLLPLLVRREGVSNRSCYQPT